MRIAILHDDFSICGGGEKLIAILAKALIKKGIETDIITFDISEETKKIIPKGIKIKTIINKKFSSRDDTVKRYLFSKLNLDNYDFFIFSGNLSLCTAKKHKPNLLYCHNIPKSEMIPKKLEKKLNKHDIQIKLRLIKDSFIEKTWTKLCYIKDIFIKKPIPEKIANKIDALKFLFTYSYDIGNLKYLIHQTSDKKNLRHIQKIIVNSKNIKNKVKKNYKRDSVVINPPIETKKYRYKKHKNFWISVNRITPLKRIELQLKAFSKMPNEKLYIIGAIGNLKYYRLLEKIKPDNVEFLGVLEEKDLIKRLSECKGMLFTAKDEDFGMAPVEAMASGKPVIAANEGGCKETIINKKIGILINNINEDKIVKAIKKINKNPQKYKNACIKQAKKFDVHIFTEKMEREIKSRLKNRLTIT